MKNTNLETPPYLIDQALTEFGFFPTWKNAHWVDIAASSKNKKFTMYLNKKYNTLKRGLIDKNVSYFCNPPFDKLFEWVRFCKIQSKLLNVNMMMLLPCYTDSKWWTAYIGDRMQKVDDFYFLHQRLGFYKNGKEIKSNKYYMPCVFILWKKK